MFITPFDKNYVFALLMDHVAHGVLLVTLMLDDHLVAGYFRSVDAHVQDVISGALAVHQEAVLSAQESVLETFSPNLNLKKVE